MDTLEMDMQNLQALYDHGPDFTCLKRQLINSSHVLLTKGLIENACSGGFSDADAYRFTDGAFDDFLFNEDIVISSHSWKGVIKSGSIAEKRLYYPPKTRNAIEENLNRGSGKKMGFAA